MKKYIGVCLTVGVLLSGCVSTGTDSEAERYIRIAQTARNTNNPEASLNFYKKAQELDSANPKIYLGIAQVYIDTKLLDAASEYLKKAQDKGAAPDQVAYLKGKIKLLSGKIAEAESEFSKYTSADCLNALGAVNDNKGEHAKAQRYYKQVIAKDPNYVDAYNNLGLSYLLERKYKDAIFYLENACSFPEANVNYRSNLALAYGLSGNMNKAREIYSKDYDGKALEERINNLEDIIVSRSSK